MAQLSDKFLLGGLAQAVPVALFVFKFIFSLLFVTGSEMKANEVKKGARDYLRLGNKTDKFLCNQILAERVVELLSQTLPTVLQIWVRARTCFADTDSL